MSNVTYRMRLVPLLLAMVVFCSFTPLMAQSSQSNAGTAPAKFYVSPGGTGDRSGADAGNAMPFRQALTVINAGARSLHANFLEGDYYMRSPNTIRVQTRHSRPTALTIEGAGPKTRFIGTFQFGDGNVAPLFRLAKGDITLKNFSATNVGAFVDVESGATVRSVTIQNVRIDNVYDGIIVDRHKRFSVSNWLIDNVHIRAYQRSGIRLAGASTSNIVVRKSVIDGAGTTGGDDCHKGGIQLYESVSNVTIEDVTVMNNVGCASSYQQGEGIEADDKGGTPNVITLRNVVSIGNRDGNFDLKANNMTLENLESRSGDVSRFAYRFWNYAYDCRNCRADAAPGKEISLSRANVTLTNPRFLTDQIGWNCQPEARQSGTLRVIRQERVVDDKTCEAAP